MIYQKEGVICGITKSVYESFGIPSSLIYGNSANTNEFTIEAISKELATHEIQEELNKDGTTVYITFDSTLIQQNFLIGQNEDDRYAKKINEGNEESEDQ